MDALEGVTILDFTAHIAGPYATKVLADLGARVIKVERPGGDPVRSLGPWLHDQPGIERSGTYQFLNTNKESIVVDLKSDGGQQVIDDILPAVDLVVEAYPPAVSERLNLTYDSIAFRTHAPLVSLTNFGRTGPYRDYTLTDLVLYAMGGEMFSHGLEGREPLKMGGTAALLQSGAMTAIAALGAIHAKEAHNLGQHVEMSLFESQIANVDRRSSSILGYRWSGRIHTRPPGNGAGAVGGVYPTADGHVEVTASAGPYWRRFAAMFTEGEFDDPKWTDPAFMASPAAREQADGIVYPWMLSRTMAEVWKEARRTHAMLAPILDHLAIANDPVFHERGLWTEVDHSVLGKFPMFSRPYILEKTPWRIRHAAPMLGEHTDTILAGIGYDSARIAQLRASGAVA
jgi:crotonobetainyl-CoA:carnitine CoA-transferase CaiB-like acyl-CoA transferase